MKVYICYDNIFITLEVSEVEFKYMNPSQEKDSSRIEEFKNEFFKHNWAVMGVSGLKPLKKD